MASYDVSLYLYDISQGLAKQLLPLISGKNFEGIWHTGVVVYGREYFFGNHGIQYVTPGTTVLGHTYKAIPMGLTEVPQDIFESHLRAMAETTFRPESYHLLNHNCNNFSDEVCSFLVGKNIPSYITSLPNDVMNTPIGNFLKPLIDEIYASNHNVIINLTGPTGANLGKKSPETHDRNNSSGAQLSLMLSEFLQNSESQVEEAKPVHESLEDNEFSVSLCRHLIGDDVVSLLNELEAQDGLETKMKFEIQQCLDNLDNSIPVIFSKMAHLGNVVKERSDPKSLIACQLLQAFVENHSVAEYMLQCLDLTFFELLEDFTDKTDSPKIIEILIKCVCNLMHAGTSQFLFSKSAGSDAFLNFIVFCILFDKDNINNIACQSVSNAFLNQSKGPFKDHHQDTCFKLGISLFQMIKKGSSLDCNYTWYSLYNCLKGSNELLQFAQAMNFEKEILEDYNHLPFDESVAKLRILIKNCLA